MRRPTRTRVTKRGVVDGAVIGTLVGTVKRAGFGANPTAVLVTVTCDLCGISITKGMWPWALDAFKGHDCTKGVT